MVVSKNVLQIRDHRRGQVVVPIAVAFLLCACSLNETGTPTTQSENNTVDDYDDSMEITLDETKYEVRDKVCAYLVLGTDHSGNESVRGENYEGSLADYLALIVVNKTKKTWGILTINRNSMVDVDILDHWGEIVDSYYEQICTAHWYGGDKRTGCKNTVRAVSRLLGGFQIDRYLSIGMDQIEVINHAVGGVEVTIEDDFSAVDPSLVMGETILLNDEQAEHFVRGRKGVGNGDNIARMRRQEMYMQGLLAKIATNTTDFVDEMEEVVGDAMVMNMDDRDFTTLQSAYDSFKDLGISTAEGWNTEGDTLENGVIYEEFYNYEWSIAEILSKMSGMEPVGAK